MSGRAFSVLEVPKLSKPCCTLIRSRPPEASNSDRSASGPWRFPCSASREMDVASMFGARRTSYTTLLPAFHPPPGHMRSHSIEEPSAILRSTSLPRISPKRRPPFTATIDTAVGITQLTLSDTQHHPYFLGSKR